MSNRRAHHVWDLMCRSHSSETLLAVRMRQSSHRSRRDVDRQARRVAQDGGAQVDGRDVAQDARAEADGVERFAVPVVSCARRNVSVEEPAKEFTSILLSSSAALR